MKTVFNLSEINLVTHQLVNTIVTKASHTGATVVCLHGDLGAGKTTLASSIAKALQITNPIQSPTFVILKNYPTNHPIFKNLIHNDAYRLNHASELEQLNWSKYIQNPENIICIEWSENVPELIPENALHIYLNHIDHSTRELIFT